MNQMILHPTHQSQLWTALLQTKTIGVELRICSYRFNDTLESMRCKHNTPKTIYAPQRTYQTRPKFSQIHIITKHQRLLGRTQTLHTNAPEANNTCKTSKIPSTETRSTLQLYLELRDLLTDRFGHLSNIVSIRTLIMHSVCSPENGQQSQETLNFGPYESSSN